MPFFLSKTVQLAAVVMGLWGLLGTSHASPVHVVTSFSILGSMVQEIAGEHAIVTSLVGPNADAHAFEPTPESVKTLAKADVVVINGLRFEGWIDRMIRVSGYPGSVVVATQGLTARTVRGVADPHAWHDLRLARAYVNNITLGLSKALPGRATQFEQRAAQYLQRLDTLDQQTRASLAAVPAKQRKLITAHDSFGYLGDAYQITLLSPQGWSAGSQPSARQVGRIISQIKAEGVSAIFIENISNPRLVEQIASEAGARVGGTLYSDALSPPGGPADTYLKLMTHNLMAIRTALGAPVQ